MSLPNSYASLGRQLPARRITSALTVAPRPAPLPGPAVQQNLQGWIVPQAQIRWLGPGIAWYSPQRVEQIWRQAIAGDLSSQWELFDLMESTWPTLSKCLNQLKDAVVCQGIRVIPFTQKGEEPTEQAYARAAFVEQALHGMTGDPARNENDFPDTIRDLLDARGKGISVLEIDWTVRADIRSRPSSFGLPSDTGSLPSAFPSAVTPRCTRWVHPAWYGYPYGPGSGLLQIRVPNNPNGTRTTAQRAPDRFPGDTSIGGPSNFVGSTIWQDFPDHKFLIGLCKNKTGHPLGSALLHLLGFWWAASNFTAEWFLNFCQVFGQPFRWATYDPNMTPGDQAKLQAMLTQMGSSAWGMFPAGTTFELKDVAAKAGDNIQLALMELADKHCTQLVLRQSLTSDVGGSGSRALGEVHERVLGGVEEALCKWTCKTLSPLVRSLLILNFGDDTDCPTLVTGMDEEASPEELGKLLVDIKNAGLQPTEDSLSDIGERLGFPVERQAPPPAPQANPFAPSDPSTPSDPSDPSGEDPSEEDPSEEDPSEEDPSEDSITASSRAPGSPIDAITGPRLAALTAAYAGSMAPFRQAILASTDRADCLRRLERLYLDWSPARLTTELDHALQLCSATAAVAADGSRR